jgi:N-acetylmuramoyl-L-alanine amidase
MSSAIPGSEARIQVVYPKPQQEIYEDSTFLMGMASAVPPGAQLTLDAGPHAEQGGLPIPMSPQGFFAYKIPIHAGMNPMRLALKTQSATPAIAQELFALHGVPPLAVLPVLPLAVHEETLQPASDCWLREGDQLLIACSASVGVQVSLEIPGFLKEAIPLSPIPVDAPFVDTREPIFAQLHWASQRIPSAGYYRAHVPVWAFLQSAGIAQLSQEYLDLPLVLHLRQDEHSLKLPLPGRLSLLTQARPAVISEDRATTRTAPVSGARLTPQRQHTRVQVDGLQQGWARVRLSQEEVFYLPEGALAYPAMAYRLAAGGSAEPISAHADAPLSMGLVSIQTAPVGQTASVVSLSFGPSQTACPVQVEVIPSAEMNRLQVRLYGVCSRCDFIHYPPGDDVVRQVHWRPVAEDVLELWIVLHHPLSGYDYAWQDGQWRFTVKILPRRLEKIRVLIDPGHGGPETGSTGLNGLPEKDLNLTVSRLLRDALLGEGFQVVLSRNGDKELSLQARGEAVVSFQADIVLSLHHNALPDGRDPAKVEGACCFYYQPFAKSLAQALLGGLTDNRGSRFEVPNYGLFYDSLYMTRIHQATAVLVEIGFFTNPQEFERLIDPAFQQEAAQRLASALRTYCLPA